MSIEKVPFLARYATWVVGHRKSVILGVLIITAFLITRLGHLQIDSNPDLWAPQKHPYVVTTNLVEKIFGGKNITVIAVVPKKGDIYQPSVLAKIKDLQDKIEELPNAVRHNITSLAANKVKVIKGDSEGMEVRPMLQKIPETAEEMEKFKSDVNSMPTYKNSLVSADGKAAAVIADFKQDSTTPNYKALNAGLRKVIDEERDESVDIYMAGLPMIGEAADHEFMKMPIFFGFALLVIMLVQFWSFRSFQGMLLPIATGLLSVFWGLGLMGLFGIHLDPLNTTTPILIMAIAAGHAIQILKRYYEEYNQLLSRGLEPKAANEAAVIESMVRVGPVMAVAGAIAAITFFSLSRSGISMVKHFGIFAGFGVLSAMIIEMTIIPAVRSLLRPPKKRETARESKPGVLDKFLLTLANNLVGGRAPWFVVGGLVAIGIVGAGVFFLRVDNNFRNYLKPNSEVRVHDRIINGLFGGTNSIQFLVQTPKQDGVKDPAVLHAMDELQTFLDHQPTVGKTQSLADLMKQMNQSMHGDDPKYYVVPESRDLIAQYLLLYSTSGGPQDFDSFVDNDYQKAIVWVYLKDDGTANADRIAKAAQEVIRKNFPPDVSVQMGGSLGQVMALNEVIVNEKLQNMMQMAVVVFLLGSLVFSSFVGGLFVVIPLFAIMLTNFGLMGWMKTPLDITAMSTAAMAIGIGADYEIYLLFRFREELKRTGDVLAATRNSLLTSGKAILFVAISVFGGYSVLQVSSFAFYNQLSNMVTATMVISAFIALFFLRALMMVFKPKFIFGEQREELFRKAKKAIGGAA